MDALNIKPEPPRVFITNYIAHNYDAAKTFGDFVPVTTGTVDLQDFDRVVADVTKGILDSNHDDYLLLSGLNQLCVITAILWFQYHGRVRLLMWNKNPNEYRLLELSEVKIEELLKMLNYGNGDS